MMFLLFLTLNHTFYIVFQTKSPPPYAVLSSFYGMNNCRTSIHNNSLIVKRDSKWRQSEDIHSLWANIEIELNYVHEKWFRLPPIPSFVLTNKSQYSWILFKIGVFRSTRFILNILSFNCSSEASFCFNLDRSAFWLFVCVCLRRLQLNRTYIINSI